MSSIATFEVVAKFCFFLTLPECSNQILSNILALYSNNTDRAKGKSVELEDIKFHQCVRLSRFENDRTISFIPPDGEFELMSYRLNTHVSFICRHFHLPLSSSTSIRPR